jgi:hypothetical protein
MKCKFCGAEMTPLSAVNYDIPGRPGQVLSRYGFYCPNPGCGARYIYDQTDNQEIRDQHWYDPDPQDPEAEPMENQNDN